MARGTVLDFEPYDESDDPDDRIGVREVTQRVRKPSRIATQRGVRRARRAFLRLADEVSKFDEVPVSRGAGPQRPPRPHRRHPSRTALD